MGEIRQRPDETDDEFYARVDPYDDRLSGELPRWSCFLFIAVLVAIAVGAFRLLT